MSKTYNRFILLVKQIGFLNGMLYLINRITGYLHLNFAIHKYYFVAQPLSDKAMLPSGKGQQFRVVEILAGDLSPLIGLRPDAVISNRYAQGAVCLAAYKGDEFAGCMWYVAERYMEDEVLCLFDLASKNSVWDFDVYVDPKFRLSTAFLRLWDEANAKLIKDGYDITISRISAFNIGSLSSHKRLGAQVLGWAVFVRISRLQLTLSSIKPFLHISFSDHSFPIFKL